MLSWSRQNPKSCQAHLKLLLFAGQVCLEGVYVVEMGAAFLVVVFLVMLAFHHFLISLTQLLLLQNRRTREYFLSPGTAAFIGSVWRCWMKSIYAILFFFSTWNTVTFIVKLLPFLHRPPRRLCWSALCAACTPALPCHTRPYAQSSELAPLHNRHAWMRSLQWSPGDLPPVVARWQQHVKGGISVCWMHT